MVVAFFFLFGELKVEFRIFIPTDHGLVGAIEARDINLAFISVQHRLNLGLTRLE